MNSNIYKISIALAAVSAMAMTSCEDQPDKFELTSGKPTIKYVRVPNPEKADSLLTSAYMDNLICLVGDNLTSIKKLMFNDKEAILNTSYITKNTLLVSVPSTIPEVVTNKIYMMTADGDTCTYDFKVLVPKPSVRSISCEWAKAGTVATITGDYFIDDPNEPLEIIMPGNVKADQIVSIDKNHLSFVVPEKVESGYINVNTIYGTGTSVFQFNDRRNILFDWDGTRGGNEKGVGWRTGELIIRNPGDDPWDAIDGKYIKFGPATMLGGIGSTWSEDPFSFNYWPKHTVGTERLCDREAFAEILNSYDVNNLQIKFECLVPSSNPWSASAMQIIFIGDDVEVSNAHFSDSALPRGLWNPWQSTGSYNTADQWVTVSLPLTNFTYTHEGSSCANSLTKNMLSGLTFFLWNGGVEGTDCEPVICIDNIRVVPIE